ncbi:MAG: hypothetical protein QOH27_4155, partial [Mycobacterium sp.]|nr:hypothetical protein [Mycobacterium sp.]
MTAPAAVDRATTIRVLAERFHAALHIAGFLCGRGLTAATPSAYRGAMSIAQRERAGLVEILRAVGPD